MTNELQHAMAQYEDARIAYKKAVLASLHGNGGGEDIRLAILQCKAANAELKRLQAAAASARPAPATAEPEAESPTGGWSLVRRFLKAS